jgi:hypothetical protein
MIRGGIPIHILLTARSAHLPDFPASALHLLDRKSETRSGFRISYPARRFRLQMSLAFWFGIHLTDRLIRR